MSTMEKFDSILTKDLREVINTIKMSNFTKKRSAIWSGQSSVVRPRSRAATAPSVQQLSFISPKVTVKIPIVRDEVMDEIANKPLTHVLNGKLKRAKSASGEKTLKTQVASRGELKRAKTMTKMPQPREGDYSITRAVDDNFWVVSNSTPTSAPCKTHPYVLNPLNEKVKYHTWNMTADSVPCEEKLLPLKHEVELENVYKTGQNTNWCIFNENLPENNRRNISSSFPGESFFDVQPQTRPKLDIYLQSNTDIRIGVNGETISNNKMRDSILKKRPNSVETDEASLESESSDNNETHPLNREYVQSPESCNDSLDSFDILANDAKPNLVNPYAKEPRIRSSPFKTEVLPSDDDDDDVDDDMGELFEGCSPSLWITHKRSQSNENESCEGKSLTTPLLSYSDELAEKSNKVIVANPARPPSAKKITKTSQPIVFHKLVHPHTLGPTFVHLTNSGYKDHNSLTASDPDMNVQPKRRPITAFSKTWNHGSAINTDNGEQTSVQEVKRLPQGFPNHFSGLTQLLKLPDSSTLFQNVTDTKSDMNATKESKTISGMNKTRKEDQKRKELLSSNIGSEPTSAHTTKISGGHHSIKSSGKTPTVSATLPLTSLTLTNLGKHNSSLQPQQEAVNRLSGSYRFSAPKNSPRSSLNSDLKHRHATREDTRKPNHFRSFSQASFHSSPPSPCISRAKIVAMETELEETKNLSHHTKRGFSANPLVNRRKLQRSASVFAVGRSSGEAAIERNCDKNSSAAEFLQITHSMRNHYNLTTNGGLEKEDINYPVEVDQLSNLGSLKRRNHVVVDGGLNQQQQRWRFNRRPATQGSLQLENFKLRGDSMILNLDKYIHVMYRDLGISSWKKQQLSRPTSSVSSKVAKKEAAAESTDAGDENQSAGMKNEKKLDVEKNFQLPIGLEKSWKSYDPPIEGLRTSDLLRDSFHDVDADADLSLESEHLLHSHRISLNKRKEKSSKNRTASDIKIPVDDMVRQRTDNIISNRGSAKEMSAKSREKRSSSRGPAASAVSSNRQPTTRDEDDDEMIMRGVTKVTISNKP